MNDGIGYPCASQNNDIGFKSITSNEVIFEFVENFGPFIPTGSIKYEDRGSNINWEN